MTLVLQWRAATPNLELQWRGSGKVMTALAANPMQALAGFLVPPASIASINQYLHVQSSPSATWIVNHNLGRRPAAVSVLSPGGIEVDAGVLHNSENQLTISFNQPYAGSAVIL